VLVEANQKDNEGSRRKTLLSEERSAFKKVFDTAAIVRDA
jgi:hypothetical protein